MADVRINSVESRIQIADGESLLTPELTEIIVRAVMQRINENNRIQHDADEDRKLVEGASR